MAKGRDVTFHDFWAEAFEALSESDEQRQRMRTGQLAVAEALREAYVKGFEDGMDAYHENTGGFYRG